MDLGRHYYQQINELPLSHHSGKEEKNGNYMLGGEDGDILSFIDHSLGMVPSETLVLNILVFSIAWLHLSN